MSYLLQTDFLSSSFSFPKKDACLLGSLEDGLNALLCAEVSVLRMIVCSSWFFCCSFLDAGPSLFYVYKISNAK